MFLGERRGASSVVLPLAPCLASRAAAEDRIAEGAGADPATHCSAPPFRDGSYPTSVPFQGKSSYCTLADLS